MGPDQDPYLPTGPAFLRDPYPYYDRLRAADPVHHSDVLDAWVLTRYRDVLAGVSDARLSARRMPFLLAGLPLPEAHRDLILARSAAQMISADPPDHARLRGLASRALAPRRLAALRPRVAAIAEALLDDALADGRMDVVADFAYPLPMQVIGELLGIPPADLFAVKGWADVIAGFMSTGRIEVPEVQGYLTAWDELAGYLRDLAASRRIDDTDEDIVGLLFRRFQAGEATLEEVVANLVLFAVAGHETTTNTLALGVHTLLCHPQQLQRLQQDRSLVPAAVEEILRYEPTSQRTIRVVNETWEAGQVVIQPGSVVVLMLGAANRDPEAFPDAHRFDIGRHPNRHLTFSHGPHFCLGAALARMELQVALATLLRRVRHLEALAAEPEWRPNLRMRGLVSLPVIVEAA